MPPRNSQLNINEIGYFRTGYRADDWQGIVVIESKQQLTEYFLVENTNGWQKDILDFTQKFDNDFFKDNLLVFVIILEGSGSHRHAVVGVDFYQAKTTIDIRRVVPGPNYGTTDDVQEWHIIIPLALIDIESKTFEANITNVIALETEQQTELVVLYRGKNNVSGVWLNRFILNIGLVASDAEIAHLNATASHGGAVIFHKHTFTYRYLLQIQDALEEIMDERTIYMTAIDEIRNHVDIWLTDGDEIPRIINFLQLRLLYNAAAVNFVVSQEWKIMPQLLI